MSGWIKLEKALVESLRFKRVVRALRNVLRGVSVTGGVEISHAHIENMVLGGLFKLWSYADTHLDENDILDATLDEIDEVVGIHGFAAALPTDWLQVIDAEHVKLPDFLDHNGSSASLRKGNAKRQAAYRWRQKQRNVTHDVTERDASHNDARPDQTRPDQTRVKNARASRVTPGTVPRETDRSRAAFLRAKASYPAGTFTDSEWLLAEREFYARVEEGVATDDLVAGSAAYCLQQQAMGNERTRFITKPSKFFNGTGMWRGPFPIPQAPAGKPEDDPAARAAFDALVATDGAQRDTRTERALAQFGGWSRWKLRRVGEEARLKAEFCRAFTDAAETAPESNAGGAGAAIGKNPTRRPGETKTAQKLSALFSAQGGKRK